VDTLTGLHMPLSTAGLKTATLICESETARIAVAKCRTLTERISGRECPRRTAVGVRQAARSDKGSDALVVMTLDRQGSNAMDVRATWILGRNLSVGFTDSRWAA